MGIRAHDLDKNVYMEDDDAADGALVPLSATGWMDERHVEI